MIVAKKDTKSSQAAAETAKCSFAALFSLLQLPIASVLLLQLPIASVLVQS